MDKTIIQCLATSKTYCSSDLGKGTTEKTIIVLNFIEALNL
jgi:hypothetical protein